MRWIVQGVKTPTIGDTRDWRPNSGVRLKSWENEKKKMKFFFPSFSTLYNSVVEIIIFLYAP